MEEPCVVSLIVAVAKNGVIGAGNTIPWKCSSDMKYFRKTTMGKAIIMGRKTWESLGKPLKGRKSIVLTRNQDYEAPGAFVVTSSSQALKEAASYGESDDECEIMIIGGKAIYDEFIGVAERIYFTAVHMSPDGDTRFLTIEQLVELGWGEVSRRDHPAGERDEADMSFVVLEK